MAVAADPASDLVTFALHTRTSSSDTADSTPSDTSTLTTSCPSKATPNHSETIGFSVGVPLGVLLISSLSTLFYRERKPRPKGYTLIGEKHNLGFWEQENIPRMQDLLGELGGQRRAAPESKSRQIYEAAPIRGILRQKLYQVSERLW